MVKTEQLYYLTELDKTRSFHKCADNLFISQPAISRSIKNLEKELGVQLLERSATGVMPTEVGEKIIQKANIILEKLDNIYLSCNDTKILQQTLSFSALHISSIRSLTAIILSSVISALQKEFPNASFFFHEHSFIERLEFVSKNPYNIGFDYMALKDEKDILEKYPNLKATPLCDITFHFQSKDTAEFSLNDQIYDSHPRANPIPVVYFNNSAELSQNFLNKLIDNQIVKCIFETSTPKLYYMYISECLAATIVVKLGHFKYVSSLPIENYIYTPIISDEKNALYFFYHKDLPKPLYQYILNYLGKSLNK